MSEVLKPMQWVSRKRTTDAEQMRKKADVSKEGHGANKPSLLGMEVVGRSTLGRTRESDASEIGGERKHRGEQKRTVSLRKKSTTQVKGESQCGLADGKA